MTTAAPKKTDFDAGVAQAEKVIDLIEELDDSSWEKPWFTMGLPLNYVSKKQYRGSNIFYLQLLMQVKGWDDPRFMTYRQATELGGTVKKGEKSAIVLWWKPLFVDDKTQPKRADGTYPQKYIPTKPRYYNVFNVAQTEGIEIKAIERPYLDFTPVEAAENVVENYKNRPAILHVGDRACYKPFSDEVNMPKQETFKSVEEYYSTLFHELTHSTGHKDRLKRFDDVASTETLDRYAKEELVAELGASILCGLTGISGNEKNSAAYLKGWLSKLKDDKKLLQRAAGDAQKSTDHILGTVWAKDDETN